MNVLVIEDSAHYERAVTKALGDYRMTVCSASSDNATYPPVEVALVDYSALVANPLLGEELTDQQIPFAVTSAHFMSEDIAHAWSSGAADVISKSEHPAMLAHRLRSGARTQRSPRWVERIHDGALQELTAAHTMLATGRTGEAEELLRAGITQLRGALSDHDYASGIVEIADLPEALARWGYTGDVTIDSSAAAQCLSLTQQQWLHETLVNHVRHNKPGHIHVRIPRTPHTGVTVVSYHAAAGYSGRSRTGLGTRLQQQRAKSSSSLWVNTAGSDTVKSELLAA